MQKRISDASLSDLYNDTDTGNSVTIVNTCAVTAEATQEAIRWIRKHKKENPDQKIVVTGCSAQVDTEKVEHLPEVDLVVANSHKAELPQLIKSYFSGSNQKVFKSNIFKESDLGEGGGEEDLHTRSFLKIQDGCNSFCTFCVIPFARGKSRSLDSEQIIEKINSLEADGIKEVVLTGVHIGDYEDTSGSSLEKLIKKILEQTNIPRIRLTSLEPIEISDELLEIFKNSRMCKHFHMSIQSANTKILSLMKRKYSAQTVEESLNRIHSLFEDAYIGMDVIVGFPGETEDDFFDTYQRLDKLPWTKIHVFPYSQRPGTWAAKMTEQIERGEIKSRARRLRELSYIRNLERAHEQIGQTKDVLLLNSGHKGLSRDFWPIHLPEDLLKNFKPGSELPIQVSKVIPNANKGLDPILMGKLASY
jgi:threonylcarbamoyladenosine tRNA methylthiotransferase MtaB